jgi:hypothetical protein
MRRTLYENGYTIAGAPADLREQTGHLLEEGAR